jgi:hypothetical protein
MPRDRPAIVGMDDGQGRGVKQQPWSPPDRKLRSVERVAEHGVPERREVQPDLM